MTSMGDHPDVVSREEWEEPQGRAEPLWVQVGGPALRLPDDYTT